jgi:hypothetical protein
MAHLTDDELKELKTRVVSAAGTGANIGRANEYLLQLIAEVQEHRNPKPKIGKLKVGEMDVKKAEPAAEPPPPPEDRPSERNIPTVQISPEETKALVEKTKKPEKGGGKKK